MTQSTVTKPPHMHDVLVRIALENVLLEGNLTIPENAIGMVIFAHGSGSSRHSARNHYVARILNQHGIGTLLVDLLSTDEEIIDVQTCHLRFDIPLLAKRLVGITEWIRRTYPSIKHMKIGYFGSSTGGGAALIAAAQHPGLISVVVSRGGRPDLAGEYLEKVRAPTLLLVGERDPEVIHLNKEALEQLNQGSVLDIIPHASHLFEEPGALENVALLAAEWFAKHMSEKQSKHHG